MRAFTLPMPEPVEAPYASPDAATPPQQRSEVGAAATAHTAPTAETTHTAHTAQNAQTAHTAPAAEAAGAASPGEAAEAAAALPAAERAARETCPLCQAVFDPACANCSSSCPLAKGCASITCPSCGYSFPKPTGLAAWLARVFESRRVAAEARRGRTSPVAAGALVRPASGALTLADARPGDRVRVTAVAADARRRLSRIAAFGIVEGCELVVRQRRPAFVVEIGETTLALDAEVAEVLYITAA